MHKWDTRYWIKHYLKDILKLCKKGYWDQVEITQCEFRGALLYMLSIKEIDKQTWYKLMKLYLTIPRQYKKRALTNLNSQLKP